VIPADAARGPKTAPSPRILGIVLGGMIGNNFTVPTIVVDGELMDFFSIPIAATDDANQ